MLTLKFVPRFEIEGLTQKKKIDKLLRSVRDNKIILVEGKLNNDEQAELIRRTMEEIDEDFSGIEISTVKEQESPNFVHKVKNKVVEFLVGDRFGFTIIGPAKIVKEIKQDPEKMQLIIERGKQEGD